jgi:peptidoglycan/xylan/chitin deacetylase (PgdA/CDA1 family)
MPRFSTLVLALFLSLPLSAADGPVATILCYHEVDAAPSHATIPRQTAGGDATAEQLRYTASVEQFRNELDYLEQHDYHVIALADLVAYLNGGRAPLPPRAVVITVDDGWLCAYTEIFPELQRRKMPWTLFVYPKIVGRGAHALTWPQIAELAAAGVDVESHTYSHPFLTQLDDARLETELAGSKETIEKKTRKRVQFLSYPFGDYDDAIAAECETDGYEAAVTTHRAPITCATPPLALPRYLVHHDTTMEEFRTFLLP